MRVDFNFIFLEKAIAASGILALAFGIDFREVFYTQDLVSIPSSREAGFPTLENPPIMVLSMWRAVLLPSPWDAFLALLGMGLPVLTCPRWLDLSDEWKESPFTYFLRCFPLYLSLDSFFELITIFSMVSLNSMELAPPSQFRTHHIRLRSRRCRDVMQMENPTPDFLISSIQRRAIIYRLNYPFAHNLVLYGWGIIDLPLAMWAFTVGNVLLDITRLLFNVVILTLYVALCSGEHFYKLMRKLLGGDSLKCPTLSIFWNAPIKILSLAGWLDGCPGKSGEVDL